MSSRSQRIGLECAAALCAAAFGWAATCSWQGMIVDPTRYLVPALVAASLVALVGAIGRSLRLRWYAVLGVQLVTVLVWFHHRQGPDDFASGWIPTPAGLADVIGQVRDGSTAINTYSAPVSSAYTEAPVYLIACALLILVLVDLIACGLRLPAWAGIPALVAVTIPISVLDEGLPTSVYFATGIGFAALMAVIEAVKSAQWGPVVADAQGRGAGPLRMPARALGAPALVVAATSTLLALVVSLAIPVGDGLIRPDSDGGNGSGAGRVTLNNPLVDLRRDLVRNDRVPLLDVQTRAREVSYLRLTILDAFADGAWTPSARNLSTKNRAEGDLPVPPGLVESRLGPESVWRMETTPNFVTTWLPTPSATRSIQIDDGQWRYDPNFLDVASTETPPAIGVRYEVVAASPNFSASELARTPPAPAGVVSAMTKVPELPATVVRIAKEITADGETNHAKAALLQDWFRNSGGFRYSLDAAPGEGLDQLSRFLTTDKVGYCEQFAAAMALMARSLGIPARVVVGFLEPSGPGTEPYRFTSNDLHAWPEIYFSGAGWTRFEPTPSTRTGSTPPWTRSIVAAPDPAPSPITPTNAPTPRAVPSPETPTSESSEVGPESTGGIPTWVLVLLGVALVIILLSVPATVRSGQRRKRMGNHPDARATIEALWDELGATADDCKVPWPDTRSPRMVADVVLAWARSLLGSVPEQDRVAFSYLVTLLEQARYREAFTLDEASRSRAVHATVRWTALMRGSVPSPQAWMARILPRSVLTHRSRSDDFAGQSDDLASRT